MINFNRFLSQDRIILDLDPNKYLEEKEDILENITDENKYQEKINQIKKEGILSEIVELWDLSNKIQNKNKIKLHLIDKEKMSSSVIGKGVAVPHVRYKYAKGLVMCFIRTIESIDFSSSYEEKEENEKNVRIFIGIITNPSKGKETYLKIIKSLSYAVKESDFVEILLNIQRQSEVIKIFNDYLKN